MIVCVFLDVVTNKRAFIKNTSDIRCSTPGIRRDVKLKFGMRFSKMPIKNIIKLRLKTLINMLDVSPVLASLFIENDKETNKRQKFHLCSSKMDALHSEFRDFLSKGFPSESPTIS